MYTRIMKDCNHGIQKENQEWLHKQLLQWRRRALQAESIVALYKNASKPAETAEQFITELKYEKQGIRR